MASGSRHDTKTAIDTTSETPKGSSQQNERHLAQYGNFRNYYSIRGGAKGSIDTRVQDIIDFLRGHAEAGEVKSRSDLRILDIGCNSGEITREFRRAMRGGAETIVGVDMDRDLILLANSKARKEAKHDGEQEPEPHLKPRVLGAGRYEQGMSNAAPRKRLRIEEFSHRMGHLSFLQSDWVFNDLIARRCKTKALNEMTQMQVRDCLAIQDQDLKKYDIILALSITKWIHIQHHDIGIRRFFARVAACLASGGILILEQQGYKSYKQTLKVTAPGSQARMNFYALRVMPDDFAWILGVELGLKGPYRIRDKGENASIRQIDAYIQPRDREIPRHCHERRTRLLALPAEANEKDLIPWVGRDRQICI